MGTYKINNIKINNMKDIDYFIQEKLKINSKTKVETYNYQPQSKDELQNLLEKLLINERGENGNLNDIDVSKISDMSYLFYDLRFVKNINISEWDVSNVTDMTSMFESCKKFNCDLAKWNVHNAKNMERMFYNCKTFNSDLSKWDVKKCIHFFTMFYDCESLNQNFDDWQINKDADVQFMFGGCNAMKHKPDWYTARINS